MINFEVFRIELNYLRQVIKEILGDKASIELGEVISTLIIGFLNPCTYNLLTLSHLQAVEQYLNQIQQRVEPCEYKLLLNNIPTIRNFLEKIKFEISKC